MRVTTDAISVSATCRIGHVSLVLENEVGGTWGQEVHFLCVKKIGLNCNHRAVRK